MNERSGAKQAVPSKLMNKQASSVREQASGNANGPVPEASITTKLPPGEGNSLKDKIA